VRIIKYTHSCVRIEHEGRTLVIDPGIWSEPRALIGADAVLVTHEHTDHVDELRLVGLGVPVYAPAGADIPYLEPIPVRPGETFTAAGFPVRAVGGRHATVHSGQTAVANLGYVVDDRLYHPGDALAPPGQAIETLLVPMQASWLCTTEAVAFAREVGADEVFGIHDGQLNERGLSSLNGWLAELVPAYRYLAAGESCDKLPA
jgi:L-ascorbate metabolism protein UlaG (beta-lactamase superfamily)